MVRPEYLEKRWFHQGRRKQEIIKGRTCRDKEDMGITK
jgi:hypothetical protein